MMIPSNAAQIAADINQVAREKDFAQLRRWRDVCQWVMPDANHPEYAAELRFTADLCEAVLSGKVNEFIAKLKADELLPN